MRDNKWGAGDKQHWRFLNEENECQDGTPFRVFFGEYPHSRRANNMYAQFPDGSVVEFDGHRVRTKIVIEEANYVKTSGYSGNEVRKQCWANFYMNDNPVYRCTLARRAERMLIKAHDILGRLMELPVQLWRPDWDGLIGRRVWYREQPAVVARYYPDRGAVTLDAVQGDGFPPPVFARDDAPETAAKEDILSPYIWWFRGEDGDDR